MGEIYKNSRKGTPHKFQLAVIGNPSRVSGRRAPWGAQGLDSVNGLFYEKDRWSHQHASLRSNIQQSTFPHLRSRWSALSLQNGKRVELLPFVKLLHSYGLLLLAHQPYFLMLQNCGINYPPDRLLRQSADNYFMLYLAESLKGKSYTEEKLLRYFPLWRERVKVTNFVCCRQIPMGFGTV